MRTTALPVAVTLSLSLFGSQTVHADDFNQTALSETDFYSAIPEVVSATRMPQRLTDAPASISVIDRETIRASGALYVTDLLRLVPGFQSYSINRNKFGVTYHGVSDDFPRRLEVLIDGRSVYLPLLSTVDWNSLGIGIDDIERVEVVRGSNVPAYGSNAFLGAINIVTRSPYSEAGTSVQATGGSQDTRRLEARFSTPLGATQTRISAGHDQNEGSNLFGDSARSNYLNISSSLTPTIADTLLLEAGFTDGYAYRGDLDATGKPVVKRDHESNYQYLRWNHLLDLNDDLQFSLYHNRLELTLPEPSAEELIRYNIVPVPEPDFAAAVLVFNPDLRLDSEEGTTDIYDLEVQQTFGLPLLHSKLLWGLGYRYEQAESGTLLQDQGRVSEERTRLFGNLEVHPAERVTINLGAMLESSSTSSTEAKLSPRAAANYRLDGDSSIRLAYSDAYRMPSLLDKNTQHTYYLPGGAVYDYDVGTNHGVGPEHIETWELGYYRTIPAFNGYLDLRLFHEKVDDAIGTYWDTLPLDPSDSRIRRLENNTRWKNAGAEAQLKLRFSSAIWALLNYSYTNTTDFIRDQGPDPRKGGIERDTDPQTPLHTASLLLNFDLPQQWQFSLAHYYVDEVEREEGITLNTQRNTGETTEYNRTDLRLGKILRLGSGSSLEGALIMQNVLGNEYVDFYEFNTFDRRSYLQLTLKF
ncbi:MAG: TonB-dependent receptor [Oceanospirillaceae bacterium]|nr:TonB-dependent receptor [Oceanospirillaceae bacterium]